VTPTPSLSSNILANYAGRFSSVFLAIAFTPVYIKFLGIEAYGLIGFYITIQSSIVFLEMGLSRSCNRELSRLSGEGGSSSQQMLDTLRSLESVYWCVAIFIGLIFSLATSAIGTYWLDSSQFDDNYLSKVLMIMAWVLAVRWPVGLYMGALSGLQRQVPMNLILVVVALLYWVGAALVLWLIEPTIQAFFMWQLIVAMASVTIFVLMAWFYMPGKFSQARFSLALLRKLIPFTAGVTATSIFGTILLQADKLILSAILPLKIFAYYSVAAMIAEAVILLATPISNVIFPKMSQMIGSRAGKEELVKIFHLSSQAVNTLVIPIALILAVFSYEVLYAYTGSREIAANASSVLAILALAKLLHANMLNLYSLQLAYGQVKLALYINILSVCLFLPAVYLLSNQFGILGPAIAWLVLTLCYVFIPMPLVFREILPQQWLQWFKVDLLLPLASVAVTVSVLHVVSDLGSMGRIEIIAVLAFFGFCALLSAVFSSPLILSWVKSTGFFKGQGAK
jgi:O-antigen/teichoic acid export membrane protein